MPDQLNMFLNYSGSHRDVTNQVGAISLSACVAGALWIGASLAISDALCSRVHISYGFFLLFFKGFAERSSQTSATIQRQMEQY